MNNIFTQVSMRKPQSSTFDLSHDRKLSGQPGEMIPSLVLEVLPGDRFKISTSQLVRFAPMVAPIQHEVNVFQHYFFVPHRITWPAWQGFITGGEDGQDNTAAPYVDIDLSTAGKASLADYLGLPVGSDAESATVRVSPLPIAAFLKIGDEYYRDQNLGTPSFIEVEDGDNTTNYEPRYKVQGAKRAWQHDRYTSALPWTQKGPEATIPLGTSAPIEWIPNGVLGSTLYQSDGNDTIVADATNMEAHQSGGVTFINPGTTLSENIRINVSADHQVDLSNATAAGVIDVRNAFRLQEWLEKNARGGSRYIESILVHFGVRSSDKRLQRPEYLGGTKTPVAISEVLQTSESTATGPPQGTMAGHGISLGKGKTIRFRAEEHGYIIGIMSVVPKTAYQQGIPRHFTRFDKFDWPWPEFAHIGEQAILNKELYVSATADNDGVFGYAPRYDEMKYHPCTVHGDYRDQLDFWHWGRKFSATPVLNEDFILCDLNNDSGRRIFAVKDDSDKLWCHIYHKIYVNRKLPYFGNPKI